MAKSRHLNTFFKILIFHKNQSDKCLALQTDIFNRGKKPPYSISSCFYPYKFQLKEET